MLASDHPHPSKSTTSGSSITQDMSVMASAGVSLDPSPNRFGPNNSPPTQRIVAAEEDNRVIGPIGSQRVANRTPSAVSQGLDFPSSRSSPSSQVHSIQSPGAQPHLNSDGSLANECGDSQPNTASRARDSDSVRRPVGSVPLQGSLQPSPMGGDLASRSPWSVAAQDPKSTFRGMEASPKSGMVVKPFFTTYNVDDDDDDDDDIVGAADVLVGAGKSVSSAPGAPPSPNQLPSKSLNQLPQTAAPAQQPSRRPKGVIPTDQVITLPTASFNRLHLLNTLNHPYEFTVKGDDDDSSTVYEGFSSEQWDKDITLLNITQQEVDDLREARAGRPFSRQPFTGGKEEGGAEEPEAAVEEPAAQDNDNQAEGEEGAAEGLNDIAQEWHVMQQYAKDLEGDTPASPGTPASPTDTHTTNEHSTFVYLRFKYTHGVYRVHSTPQGEAPVVNIGDMVVVRGAHRHEGGEGTDATSVAENVGTVVADATSLVQRVIAAAKDGDKCDKLNVGTKELTVAGHVVDTLVRCTTNKDRKMFYQARRREASTSSCAERIVQTLKLPLRICDCEFQSDFGRLTLFYKLTASQLDELVAASVTKQGKGADKDAIRSEIVIASVRVLLKEMYNQFHCRVWALDWDTELEVLFPLGQLGPVRGRQRRDARGRIVPLTVLPAVRLPRPVNVVASVVKRKKKRKTEDEAPQVGDLLPNGRKMPVGRGGGGGGGGAPPQYRTSNLSATSSVPYHPPSPMSTSSSFIASVGATVGVPSPAAGSPGMFFYPQYESPHQGYMHQASQSMPGMYSVPGGTFIPHPPMMGGYPSPMGQQHGGYMASSLPQTQQYVGVPQQFPYMQGGYQAPYPSAAGGVRVPMPMPHLNGGAYY